MSSKNLIDLSENEGYQNENIEVDNNDHVINDIKSSENLAKDESSNNLPYNVKKQLLNQPQSNKHLIPSSSNQSAPLEANVTFLNNEDTPILGRNNLENSHIFLYNQDKEFAKILKDVESAIENGIYPERIVQGSSGSYFVKNTSGVSLKHIIQ